MEDVFKFFGEDAFVPAAFYQHASAIRFELASGRTRIEQFQCALHRSWEVSKVLFADAGQVTVCLSWYSPSENYLVSLSRFRRLAECDISIPHPRNGITRPPEEGVDEFYKYRHFLFCKIPFDDLYAYLWGTIADELGIKPSLQFLVYVFDPELGVMMHPYDDRGMDVYGPNRHKIASLYATHNHWLLDYDRAEMLRRYG